MEPGEYWINKLNLKPHSEGGHYKRTYCSKLKTLSENRSRFTASMIYFLLNKTEKSHFHRLKSDEIWLYQKGSPVEICIIDRNGELNIRKLGDNFEDNQELQIVISSDSWFAAKLINEDDYALMTCFVTPSFDFEDFELAKKEELIRLYPKHEFIIKDFL